MVQEIEFAIGPITITATRAQVVDYMASFLSVQVACFLRSDVENGLLRVINPLHRNTWFLIVGSLFFTAGLMCLLNRFSPFGAWNQACPESISDEISLTENTWSLFGGFVQQGELLALRPIITTRTEFLCQPCIVVLPSSRIKVMRKLLKIARE